MLKKLFRFPRPGERRGAGGGEAAAPLTSRTTTRPGTRVLCLSVSSFPAAATRQTTR